MGKEMDRTMQEKVIEIGDFVIENRVEADDSGAECSDGRYKGEQSRGRIRIFGADLGVLMALRAALNETKQSLSTKDLFNKYYTFLKEERGEQAKIYWHIDSHHPLPEISCGHVKNAASGKYEKDYGMTAKDAQEIWEEVQKHEHTECKTLYGSHDEKAVLLIHSSDFSVNSQNEDGSEMYFVVDVERTNSLLERVAKGIGIKDVTSDQLKKAYWNQVKRSSEELAPNIPQFSIEFGRFNNPLVKHIQ